VTLTGLLFALPASAQAQAPSPARLAGTFAMSGHITIAVNVKGEFPGEQITRTWRFVSQCPTGQCASVTLARSRASGLNTVTLYLRSPGYYTGSGRLYAPLACEGHLRQRGESVPFVITVQVTGATESDGVTIASSVRATYTNRKRLNLTKCVLPPSRDSAVYQGQLA
jgi:hypothetical protein